MEVVSKKQVWHICDIGYNPITKSLQLLQIKVPDPNFQGIRLRRAIVMVDKAYLSRKVVVI